MKALITGISGFAGPYLKKELRSRGYEVFGMDRSIEGDIRDKEFVKSVVGKVNPDEIYHLAGFSSVGKSFKNPDLVMEINVGGTKNLLESVRKFSSNSKVLIVSSAEVYGKPSRIPISENESVKETSPYSKSRIQQEKLADEFKDLFIIISRSFNHTGPGQSEMFVLPDFVKQVVEIEKGMRDPVVYTGNLDVVRDFSDVRDVVRAYMLLMEKGKKSEIYNVGSGKGYNLRELLEKIIKISGKDIKIVQDPEKVRPVDIPELVADISKIKKDIGWKPRLTIDKTIKDLLNYWRDKLI